MHRVNNVENLRKLLDSVTLTHLFIAEEEYSCDPDLFEKLAETISVVIIANGDFTLPRGSKARILEKPFYCFPVAAVLNSKAAGNEGDSQNIYCKGIRALAVDDEPMNLVVAQNIFKRYGMSVTTASSGQESIDLCRENDYDIVFMDHMMPGMDGVEAMKRIRASRADKAGRNGDMPIVALTANAVSSAKEMFLSEGFDGFVSKPIELAELERTLKKVLPRSAITSVIDRDKTEESLPESTPEANEPAASEPEESAFDRLAKAGIDTSVGMSYCMDDTEFYESLLMQFVSEAAEKRSTIAGCFESRDLKNYAIYVHALKSTSKMLGHLSLSKKAEALEFASKDGNLKFVEENHQAMMEEYIRLTEDIAGIYGIADPFSDDLGEKEDE